MLVVVHVLIALAGLACAGYSYISPSKTRLWASMALIALTLASGTYLVIISHSPLLPACEAGLVYLAFAISGILAGHRKLSLAKTTPVDKNK